jgi:predicted transcriptional regulator
VNVPLKKRLGEWTIDIDFDMLQIAALNMLARKPTPLSGNEIGFIIDYLKMSVRDFAKLFGVTHPAVAKWIKEKVKMNPGTEVCLRFYILNYLKVTDKEFRKLYSIVNPENLANSEKTNVPFEFTGDELAC